MSKVRINRSSSFNNLSFKKVNGKYIYNSEKLNVKGMIILHDFILYIQKFLNKIRSRSKFNFISNDNNSQNNFNKRFSDIENKIKNNNKYIKPYHFKKIKQLLIKNRLIYIKKKLRYEKFYDFLKFYNTSSEIYELIKLNVITPHFAIIMIEEEIQ